MVKHFNQGTGLATLAVAPTVFEQAPIFAFEEPPTSGYEEESIYTEPECEPTEMPTSEFEEDPTIEPEDEYLSE